MELGDREREEIIGLIRAGRPLPARYRATLFEDALETELIWPGKSTDTYRVVLPFQSIEHIDEPRSGSIVEPDLFSLDSDTGRQSSGWTNKLIWADNRLVMSSLANGPLRDEIDAAGGISLVYIDPPFDVGADFSHEVEVGGAEVVKAPSFIEEIAYRDTWGRGRDSYVAMMYERLQLIHDLLAPTGSLYVHLDARVGSHVRLILDEIFGPDSFQREIIWRIGWVSGYKSAANNWIRNHDQILYYVKDPENFVFNKEYIPYPDDYVRRDGKRPTGKGYPIEDVWNASPMEFELSGAESLDSIQIKSFSGEKVGYATQKNESLIRRIIRASSNPGDLVADWFAGSGTTCAAAEQLGRSWIGVDMGRYAIHTSRKRMIMAQRELQARGKPYRAFEVLNLGSYERQYFVGVDMSLPEDQRKASSEQRREQYLSLILSAYGAQRSEQLSEFPGVKGVSAVFIGPLDAPVTEDDVGRLVASAMASEIVRVDVLGFEFEMGIKPLLVDEAKAKGVALTLRYIPNEVFDKRAIAKGQVKFYDVGYLEATATVGSDRSVVIELADFGVFYAQEDADSVAEGLRNGKSRVVVDGGQVVDVSKDKKGVVSKKVLTESWSDWIDYWCVDFDYESQREIVHHVVDGEEKEVWTGRYIFENEWQDFRTRGDRSLRLSSEPHTYEAAGDYRVGVKVIDVFGNDTTKVVVVKVT